MIRKSLIILAGGLALLTSAIAPVSAEEPTAEQPLETLADIAPDADREGRPAGYYLGRSGEGGIALRTHGPNGRHHFTAVLRTNGRFVDVEEFQLESGDFVRVSQDGHTLRYNVHTFDGVDGVNFRVRGGTVLSFHLELEGTLIGADHIFLGAAGHHPLANPFRIRL